MQSPIDTVYNPPPPPDMVYDSSTISEETDVYTGVGTLRGPRRVRGPPSRASSWYTSQDSVSERRDFLDLVVDRLVMRVCRLEAVQKKHQLARRSLMCCMTMMALLLLLAAAVIGWILVVALPQEWFPICLINKFKNIILGGDVEIYM